MEGQLLLKKLSRTEAELGAQVTGPRSVFTRELRSYFGMDFGTGIEF